MRIYRSIYATARQCSQPGILIMDLARRAPRQHVKVICFTLRGSERVHERTHRFPQADRGRRRTRRIQRQIPLRQRVRRTTVDDPPGIMRPVIKRKIDGMGVGRNGSRHLSNQNRRLVAINSIVIRPPPIAVVASATGTRASVHSHRIDDFTRGTWMQEDLRTSHAPQFSQEGILWHGKI